MERIEKERTIGQGIGAYGSLQMLAGLRLDMKMAHEISKFANTINPHIETYNKTRQKFYEDNGVFSEKAGGFTLTDGDSLKRYGKANEEILKEVITVNVPTMTFEELEKAIIPAKDKDGKKERVGISFAALSNLDFMITEGDSGN